MNAKHIKKILVIEDDQDLGEIYKNKLGYEGFECILSQNGNNVVSLALSEKPDLIILDVMLPDSPDGFVILKDLKKNPSTKTIPVILSTNIENRVLQAIEQGAVWYFVKAQTPIQKIVDKIREILVC